MMIDFDPPPFRPHPFLRAGHLQTIASVRVRYRAELPTTPHPVGLSDGDTVMIHEDRPPGWTTGDPSVLLIHGLCGCHSATYMVRLADRFYRGGTRAFRMDLRGCGAGAEMALGLNHAGRSDDVIAALAWIAERTGAGPIGVLGVSLGGNQLLRGLGRIGGGEDSTPAWFGRVRRAMAVAPPIDLARCAANLQRWSMWPYNRYFVRMLLARVPARVRGRAEFRAAIGNAPPRTIRELDDRVTAPLSGFVDSADYYARTSSGTVLRDNPVPTLIVAAGDDPIVPVDCFADFGDGLPSTTRMVITPRGGHVGFIEKASQNWLDDVAANWLGL